MFSITARDIGLESDNSINYSAGPIDIRLDLDEMRIVAATSPEWADLFPEFKRNIIRAWEIKEEDVVYEDKTLIYIDLKHEILINYLKYTVVLL